MGRLWGSFSLHVAASKRVFTIDIKVIAARLNQRLSPQEVIIRFLQGVHINSGAYMDATLITDEGVAVFQGQIELRREGPS
ncbi:MAG: hypothetical protein WKF84_28745 [Pyrinomonadaceae bacterium]